MNLKNKMVLITGGTSGLGLEVTKQLLKKGASVRVLGKSEENLSKLKKTLLSSKLKTILCDISNHQVIHDALKDIGKVDVLINNAGVFMENPLEESTAEGISQLLDINLKGAIYTTREILPQMKKQNEGFILNVSSTSGLKGKPLQAVYAASKWGLQGFIDALKVELLPTKIRIATIYPGGMQTKLFAKAGIKKDTTGWLEPQDVAEVVIFILERPNSMLLEQVVINKTKRS